MDKNPDTNMPVENICHRCLVFEGEEKYNSLCLICFDYTSSPVADDEAFPEFEVQGGLGMSPMWSEASSEHVSGDQPTGDSKVVDQDVELM